MSVTCKLMYKGELWEYVYVIPDGIVNQEDRERLMWNMVNINTREKSKRDVKGKNFEARIKAGKFGTLGIFSGQVYHIHLETNRGESNPSALLLKKINPNWN